MMSKEESGSSKGTWYRKFSGLFLQFYFHLVV